MMVGKISIMILLWLIQESHNSASTFCTEWANQKFVVWSESRCIRDGRVQEVSDQSSQQTTKRKGLPTVQLMFEVALAVEWNR